ncbi:hypothetical protein AB0D56_36745 [Streptomyces sp. NPDC048209]|uniref:hypothetical protein n=1 Tax=Streptomyces sp. NPDC048209 TaxID=3156689 RepID=UPI00342D5E2B
MEPDGVMVDGTGGIDEETRSTLAAVPCAVQDARWLTPDQQIRIVEKGRRKYGMDSNGSQPVLGPVFTRLGVGGLDRLPGAQPTVSAPCHGQP